MIDGDNSTLTYEYQEYAPVSPSGTERITTKSGKVYYQDGKYSTDGENWFTEAPETSYVEVGFTLNLKNLGAYEVSTDKKTLTAVLTAEEAKLVLGMEVSATEDGVELVVETNGSKLIKTSVKYNTELAEIVIDTSYEYLPITPEQ